MRKKGPERDLIEVEVMQLSRERVRRAVAS